MTLETFVAWFVVQAASAAHLNQGRDPETGRSRFTQIGRARHRDEIRRLLVQLGYVSSSWLPDSA